MELLPGATMRGLWHKVPDSLEGRDTASPWYSSPPPHRYTYKHMLRVSATVRIQTSSSQKATILESLVLARHTQSLCSALHGDWVCPACGLVRAWALSCYYSTSTCSPTPCSKAKAKAKVALVRFEPRAFRSQVPQHLHQASGGLL
ncbi:unnamed protein product [Pleuronectes platessa]|uniref:Uncharacterized protein n=1 Tax=Pleuronectes platessa TaxID=8262 RepID=A0A9N7V100_PLEPL|nr:unnamed protein product [Pleuronectes platessa]